MFLCNGEFLFRGGFGVIVGFRNLNHNLIVACVDRGCRKRRTAVNAVNFLIPCNRERAFGVICGAVGKNGSRNRCFVIGFAGGVGCVDGNRARRLIQNGNRFGLLILADGAGIGLYTGRRCCCRGGDYALVPSVICFVLFDVVSASGSVPVFCFVARPRFRKSVRVVEFCDGFGLLITADGARDSFYAFGCFGGLGGDYALVPNVICFVPPVVVTFGCALVPVLCVVPLPLRLCFVLVIVASNKRNAKQ